MPTNANTFNSRVTSEALEKKFRDVFPAQGGAELVQDLFASGVIQPVIDFSSVAEGSVLPQDLQQAWDFSTGHTALAASNATLINNTGFWKVDLIAYLYPSAQVLASLSITDGLSSKKVWDADSTTNYAATSIGTSEQSFIVFLRAGDSLVASTNGQASLSVWWRQVADVNGNLTNPLGFTFS